VGLKETSPAFQKYLDKSGLHIGCKIQILEKIDFDSSMELKFESKKITISKVVAENILVTD
jgi:DtxR family Mn-dependent transcriptional regulator